MSAFGRLTISVLVLAWVILPGTARAETTCELYNCVYTITIKMVAVGGDQQTIDGWTEDIENVWNGPVQNNGDSPTHGECECDVHVDVQFDGWVPDCSNPAANGYHCIEVTPGYVRDTSNKLYRAYMRGVSKNGSSISGWWSSEWVNTPAVIGPGQGQEGPPALYYDVHDAAHEAGHMMGLEDEDPPQANIMGVTWGEAARPTQGQIDQIVGNNCEGQECPDECCCGNGEIEADKNEECDPEADPNGCEEGEWCIDCQCFNPEDPCGNGTVDEGEECDPEAEPTGCMTGETCNEFCVCEPPPPVYVLITSPPEGSLLVEPTPVTASAESPFGIERVSFLLNEVPYDDFEAPYEWVLDPLLLPPGTHEICAVAHDLAGRTAEDSLQFDVEAILAVAITEPAPGSLLTAETAVAAEVTSNAGVESVTFLVDGLPTHEVYAAPYLWTFVPALYPPGPHEIAVQARDAAGGEATDAIPVIVDLL